MTNLLDSVNSENAPFTFRENVINGYLIEFPVYFSTRKEKSSSVLLWNVMYHIEKHVHIGFSKKRMVYKIKQQCFEKVHLRRKNLLKFMFSKKATKIDELFTIDLKLCSQCQINGEYFVDYCCLLRKHEL